MELKLGSKHFAIMSFCILVASTILVYISFMNFVHPIVTAVSFTSLLVIEIIVDAIEFLLLWRLATGNFPFTFKPQEGTYIKVTRFNQDGRFLDALEFNVDEILGLTRVALYEKQIYDMNEEMRLLKEKLKSLEGIKSQKT